MISLSGLVTLLVWLIIGGLVLWLCWWLVAYIGPPEPFRKVANVILAIAAVLFLIGLLLSIVGAGPIFRP